MITDILKKFQNFVFIFNILNLLINYSYSNDLWKNYTTKDGLVDNAIQTIAVDDDSIWFGTKNGLSKLLKADNSFKNFNVSDGLPSNEITSIGIDTHNIWIGTKSGLAVYNKDSQKFKIYTTKDGLISNIITSILVTSDEIWVGTNSGISVYNKSTGGFINYTTKDGLFHNTITSIISDGSNILVGTYGSAINVFNKIKNTWELYAPQTTIYTNIVLSTQGEFVWSGTNGGGIRVYNKQTKNWNTFTRSEGLGDENISALVSDGIFIWCGTFDGVSCFNTQTKSWKVYSSKDGLIDASITAIGIDGNFIWFGTDNGVTRFNKSIPEVKISVKKSFITTETEPVEIDCIAFSYNEIKNYKIEYSTATFPNIWISKGITISKKIEDKKFTATLDLSDIPSKTDFYNLKLTVTDVNENTNSATTTLIIDVVPPLVTINKEKQEAPVGIFTVGGTYNKDKIEKIILSPGNIHSILNRNKKTYYAITNLKEGENIISVTAYDWVGRTATASAKFIGKKVEQETVIQVSSEKEGEGSKLIIGEKMLFESGSAELKPDVFPTLDKIIDILKKYPDSDVRIEGHTDNVPLKAGSKFSSNLELSKARAKNVFYYFAKEGKIPVERMKVEGYGETKPIAPNTTEEGRAQNRRVEIIIEGPKK
jgi:flagellar motor protein MotB